MRKVSRILAVILLIVSLMSLATIGVYAADVPDKVKINGWKQYSYEDEVTEDVIEKVTINGMELTKSGTLELDPGQTVTVKAYLKNGYRVSLWIETGISLCDTEYENNWDSSDPWEATVELEIPSVSSLETSPSFWDCFLMIPVEEDPRVINRVDLDIKAPEAGTVVKADEWEDGDGYYWLTQKPRPSVSVPEDADYELFYIDDDELEGDEALISFWVVAPVEYLETELYVNGNDKPCVESGETMYAEVHLLPKEGFYFSNTVDVNVTGGEFTGISGYIGLDEETKLFTQAGFILSTKVAEEEVPDTGDSWSALWLVISLSSAAALAGVQFCRKKLQ